MLRFMKKLARNARPTNKARAARRAPRRVPLQVEGLEDRLVLSTTLPSFVANELNALQTSIAQQVFGNALPIVGTALSKLGNGSASDPNPINRIVGSFEKALTDGAQAAITQGPQAIQSTILNDLKAQGVGSILQNVTLPHVGADGFTAEVHLHQDQMFNTGTVDLNLNLGLPGLPFQVAAQNAAVNVQAGYDVVLDFGMHNGSPFLQAKADPSNTANPLGIALNVNAQIAPGSTINATLGGLKATLTQASPQLTANVARAPGGNPGPTPPPPSKLGAALDFGFSVDPKGGIQIATPEVSFTTQINLQASLTLDDSQPGLAPSVTAGLNVNWSYNSANTNNAAPMATFNDVTIDLGSFLSNVVRPVVTSIQQFTLPLQHVVDVLNTQLPGVSQVTSLLGMGQISLKDLIGGQAGSSLKAFTNLITSINQVQLPASGSIRIDVGSFNVADARVAKSPVTNLTENAAIQQKGLRDAVGGPTAQAFSNLQTSANFDFPMLDNPLSFVSNVLMGQQVDLVKANLGVDLNAGFNLAIPFFGIPHIAEVDVNFFGSLGIHAGATFALTDAFLLGGSLLDSLQVQNAHVDVSLSVGAGVGLDIGIAGASLSGTVSVNFDLGLTNKATHSTTFTGSDLVNGNVALNFNKAQLQGAIQFNAWWVGGSYTVNDPLFTEDLITGATTDSGGGTGPGGANSGDGNNGGANGGTNHKRQ